MDAIIVVLEQLTQRIQLVVITQAVMVQVQAVHLLQLLYNGGG